MHDESLVVAAQAGAEWAWDRLYRSVAPQVRGFLIGNGAGDPDALLGDVFLDAARGINRFEGTEKDFRSWVFTIARRRLIDQRRRDKRRPTVELTQAKEPTDPIDVEEAALSSARLREMLAMLEILTKHQREVLLLRMVSDLSLQETAIAMEKSVAAIKVLQHRAITRLRRAIERAEVTL